ncbi:osteopontin [Hippoglossus hippoglossus]|uniref:osteopontin n=1 Tax=Hippoglossus hippoglossus TaxID=8267 RepID=UPI00148C9ABE|nr:osteopontin [Hippoglossus hippoglossus]
MKVAVVFILLFATVLCRPAKKVSLSSSESSEEVLRRQAAKKQAALVPQDRVAPVQAASSASDESAESSEQGAAVAPVPEDTSVSPDPTPTSDTTDSQDSEDDDDDDETEEDEDESSESSESGESSSPAPATVSPTVFTEEPMIETTEDPIVPTIVFDPETARGDNLGRYPGEYKSIIYVEDKSYNKLPSPYKSWEYVNTGKKVAYDMTDGNEVEKSLPVYKAIQVHSDILEEDTSTPEMESQGLDATQDPEITARQASLPGEEEIVSASNATTNESSSASDSDSASAESQDEESSEEATATPGAADSDSDESVEDDSDEEVAIPDATTDMPMVIAAK